MSPDEILSIGIDLGGTNTSVGLVNRNGTVNEQITFNTATPDPNQWVDRIIDNINSMLSKHKAENKIAGIGIGAPCANILTGSIEAATDLPWPSPIPLVEMVRSKTRYPVKITNDANAAAIGEMIYGEAKHLKNFIVLTLGTGVGAGVVVDGHLLSGKNGFAGELGHVTFPFAVGRSCGCGREGCLQTIASAKGIIATTKKFLEEKTSDSLLRNIPVDDLTSKKVAEAALIGDSIAKDVFEFTGNCLGKAIAEFAAFTDPEKIILFGGVSKAGDLLLRPLRRSFSENVLHLYKNTDIVVSSIPESQAAVLGAAALPFTNS